MKITALLTLFLFLIGCQSAKIRPDDLNSWKGKSQVDVERHPFFSTLVRDKRDITEDEVIINFTEFKKTVSSPSGLNTCFGGSYMTNSNFGLGSSFCSNQRTLTQHNCVHQFKIRDGIVESYTVVGELCSTTCNNRPSKENCKD